MNFKFGLYWRYGDKKGSLALIHRPFHEGIRDFRPAFLQIAQDVLEPYVMRAFSTEGKSDGIKWADLAPSTLRGRPNTPILQVTGALMRSFLQGDPEHVQEVTPTKLVWGSRNITALFHEFGTGGRVNFRAAGVRKGGVVALTEAARARYAGARRGGMPARPPLVSSRFWRTRSHRSFEGG